MFKDLCSKLIFGKYILKKLIAKGTFSQVYLGKNIKDNNDYALKIEDIIKVGSYLKEESYILVTLKGPGIPEVKGFGRIGKYNILVQNLLGKSIEKIWNEKGKKFNLKDTCMFAIQGLERLEYVHSKNYLHRDIKPGNFVVGNPDSSQIYLIDFGNAKKYRSSRTGKHIKINKNNLIYGTTIFLSLNALNGIKLTRKDELESFGLVLIYLHTSNLPWSNLKFKTIFEALNKIREMRKKLSMKSICAGMPPEMCEYMNYINNLNFRQNPDYRYLRSLFLNILKNIGEKNDFLFSWVDKNIKIKRLNNSKSKSKSLQRIYENLLSNSENNKDIVHKSKTKEILITDINNNNYSTNMSPTKNDYIKKNNKRKIINIDIEDNKNKKIKSSNNNIKTKKKILDTNLCLNNLNFSENRKKLNSNNIRNNLTTSNIINKKNLGDSIAKTNKYITNYNFKLVNNINNNDRIKKDNLNIQNEKTCNLKTKKRNCIKINNLNIYKNNNNNFSYIKVFNNNTSKLNFRNSNNNKINRISLSKPIGDLKTTESEIKRKKQEIKKHLNYRPTMYKPIYDSALSYKINSSELNRILLKPKQNYREISSYLFDLDRFKNVNEKYSPERRFTSNNSRTQLRYKSKLYHSPSLNKNYFSFNYGPNNNSRF